MPVNYQPSQSQSPLMGIMSMIQSMGGAGKGGTEKPPGSEEAPSAIDRAISDKNSDPNMVLHQGLQAANDPSLDLPYEQRMDILSQLTKAKLGMKDGQGGEIKSGTMGGGNPAGIASLVAAIA